MSKIITITGVSGVGKSYLINGALKSDNALINDVSLAEFGSIFRKYLIDNNIEEDQVSLAELKHFTNLILNKINTKKPLILISHLLINFDSYLLMSPENEGFIKPSAYVVIQDTPFNINQRRQQFFDRKKRRIESINQIKFMQDLITSIAEQYARRFNAAFFKVHNNNDGVENLKNIISSIIYTKTLKKDE